MAEPSGPGRLSGQWPVSSETGRDMATPQKTVGKPSSIPSSPEDVKNKLDGNTKEMIQKGTERVGEFLMKGSSSGAGYALMGMAFIKTPFSEDLMKRGLGLRGREAKFEGHEAAYRREKMDHVFNKMWYSSVEAMYVGMRNVAFQIYRSSDGDGLISKGAQQIADMAIEKEGKLVWKREKKEGKLEGQKQFYGQKIEQDRKREE